MQKVMIIGCPGSGKSTFARALHEITALPLYHLDMLYWNPDKTVRPKEVFRAEMRRVLDSEAFIIDGNYNSTIELRLSVCDTVFFLDYPVEICLDGIRARRGKPRSDMPWYERENEEDAEFLAFVKSYNEESRPRVLELLERYKDGKAIIVFHSREEADAYLAEKRR